ncbi:MAG: cadmium-translocating P-type ATPase [Alphaproteobacteria bacterium]|nr:cadmium-translocating P-type ATPase [Alphaproteobacteria bacterium]
MKDKVLSFGILGLNCASCVSRAEAALSAISGAQDARVNLATQSGQVKGIAPIIVVQELAKAGYPVDIIQAKFKISSMLSKVQIEQIAEAVPGVLSAKANLSESCLEIKTVGSIDDLREALLLAGCPASRVDGGVSSKNPVSENFFRFMWSAALTTPVFLIEMGGHLLPAMHHWIIENVGLQNIYILQLILTTLVLVGPGADFFRRGVPALINLRPNMDALVVLGAGSAFVFSTVAVITPKILPPSGVYFEAAAVIVTLILLGRWLEERAKGKTGDAVRRIIGLRPDTVEIVDGNITKVVPLDQAVVDDILMIRPGERVAVDGIVVDGQTYIDESMLTGEPVPVFKSAGDIVNAGTLGTTGSLKYKATHVGLNTVLARIAILTEEAQAARLPVQELVNKIIAWFVPAVLIIAAITFIIWLFISGLGPAVVAGVSVLIIACPCAMGLATPMSIMVGTGRAAELGVLFHKGTALQRLQDVKVVAFDKTGTLTCGAPYLTEIHCNGDTEYILRLAGGVESRSEHPIAYAIVDTLTNLPKDVQDFNITLGEGATAQVEGHSVYVGNINLLRRFDVKIIQDMNNIGNAWAKSGITAVHVAIDGVHVGVLGVSDPIRDHAAEAISAIFKTGRQVVIISGDAQATTDYVASQLGINVAIGSSRPEGKVNAINALRAKYGAIAFVGDGINDAPALAAADVGLAVNNASDVAIEAADILLLSPDPNTVLRALSISQATLRNIWQNLVWAFGYNILLIPVAAGALVPFGGPQLSPALAALAMALSSVFVVSNALRLRRKVT